MSGKNCKRENHDRNHRCYEPPTRDPNKVIPPATHTKLEIQEYFTFLSTEDAWLLFRIRAQVFDFKVWQKYDDLKCRLCGTDVEDVYHVLNDCTSLTMSPENIVYVYSLQRDKIEDILMMYTPYRETK